MSNRMLTILMHVVLSYVAIRFFVKLDLNHITWYEISMFIAIPLWLYALVGTIIDAIKEKKHDGN
jgi:accessory gene regulator protein AgrB